MKDSIFALIQQERERQQDTLGMIPSENMPSKAVREAVGSVLIGKYAEGQAGSRYYQGNGIVDEVEGLCKRRALKVFGLDNQEWGVNVQALSGSPANLAIYNALLEPGDLILSMFLPDGGHLSHGWKTEKKDISIVSKFWKVAFYKTDPKTRMFDYDAILEIAEKRKPKMIVSGGTAYPREIDHERMAAIAQSVGAYYLADVSHEGGLIAAGVNQSPFGVADIVMMTTHKTLRGPRGALIFSKKNYSSKDSPEKKDLSTLIDFSVFPGIQGGPHINSIAGIAVALGESQSSDFKNYATDVVANARTLAQGLKNHGFDVVSGGTDKHLVLVDLRNKDVSGWIVAWALEAAGIIVNKNTVPQETASPVYPSGIRLGTPLLTTRGLGVKEMEQIVEWIDRVVDEVQEHTLPDQKDKRKLFTQKFLNSIFQDKTIKDVRREVYDMCKKFPLE